MQIPRAVLILMGIVGAVYPSANAQVEVPVAQFGAQPNDGVDDIDAIRAAIAALPASDAVLTFQQGVYDLNPITRLGVPGATPSVIFSIQSKTRVTIAGNGATLLCHEFDPTRPFDSTYYDLFNVWGCTDIEFRDLTINMSRLPFTMGTCTGIVGAPAALASRSSTVSIAPSFIPQGGTLQNMKIHALVNWRSGSPNGQEFFYVATAPNGSDLFVSSIAATVNHTIKGNTKSFAGGNMMTQLLSPPAVAYGKLQVGDDVVFAHQFSHYIAFSFADCTRSFLTNLTVHIWPGMVVNMLRDTDIVIDGMQVIPDPQRPWPISATTDAIHLANISGSVQVQGCHLEGMLDDGFNSYTNLLPPVNIATSSGLSTVTVQAKYDLWVYPNGTIFEFYDKDMIPLGTSALYGPSTNSVPAGNHYLIFSSLPAPAASIAYLCNSSQFPTSTELSGTTVLGNRGNGFRLRRDTVVTGCNFDRVSAHGLEIGPSIGVFNEGPGGGNILVEDSIFLSCGRGWGLGDYQEGTINVRMANSIGVWHTGPFGALSGITLRRLTIRDSGGAAVSMRSTDQITIDQCIFGSSGDLGTLPNLHSTSGVRGVYAARSLLFFHESGHITITDNVVESGATIMNGDRWGTLYGTYIKTNNAGF